MPDQTTQAVDLAGRLEDILDGVTSIDTPKEGCIGFMLPPMGYQRIEALADEAAALLRTQAEEIERLNLEADEIRAQLGKIRRRKLRDGTGDTMGDLLDNQAWIILSHVGSRLTFLGDGTMEKWQDAYAEGLVQKGYFTEHRGVAAWIAKEVNAYVATLRRAALQPTTPGPLQAGRKTGGEV